jgi:hypothetical protein
VVVGVLWLLCNRGLSAMHNSMALVLMVENDGVGRTAANQHPMCLVSMCLWG